MRSSIIIGLLAAVASLPALTGVGVAEGQADPHGEERAFIDGSSVCLPSTCVAFPGNTAWKDVGAGADGCVKAQILLAGKPVKGVAWRLFFEPLNDDNKLLDDGWLVTPYLETDSNGTSIFRIRPGSYLLFGWQIKEEGPRTKEKVRAVCLGRPGPEIDVSKEMPVQPQIVAQFAKALEVLHPPQDVIAAPVDFDDLVIEWQPVEGASRYELYLRRVGPYRLDLTGIIPQTKMGSVEVRECRVDSAGVKELFLRRPSRLSPLPNEGDEEKALYAKVWEEGGVFEATVKAYDQQGNLLTESLPAILDTWERRPANPQAESLWCQAQGPSFSRRPEGAAQLVKQALQLDPDNPRYKILLIEATQNWKRAR